MDFVATCLHHGLIGFSIKTKFIVDKHQQSSSLWILIAFWIDPFDSFRKSPTMCLCGLSDTIMMACWTKSIVFYGSIYNRYSDTYVMPLFIRPDHNTKTNWWSIISTISIIKNIAIKVFNIVIIIIYRSKFCFFFCFHHYTLLFYVCWISLIYTLFKCYLSQSTTFEWTLSFKFLALLVNSSLKIHYHFSSFIVVAGQWIWKFLPCSDWTNFFMWQINSCSLFIEWMNDLSIYKSINLCMYKCSLFNQKHSRNSSNKFSLAITIEMSHLYVCLLNDRGECERRPSRYLNIWYWMVKYSCCVACVHQWNGYKLILWHWNCHSLSQHIIIHFEFDQSKQK